MDEDHTRVVAEVARRLEHLGWAVELEVTYSEFGERGSIDVLGLRPAERAIAVIEVKTDIPSSEALGRKVDEKARLAPGIVAARHGWNAASVGRIVVMPDTSRLRRLVERHAVIGRMFPVDALAIRRWLRRPSGAMAGLWFLSDMALETGRETPAPVVRRVRPGTSVERPSRAPVASRIGVKSAGSGRAESVGD